MGLSTEGKYRMWLNLDEDITHARLLDDTGTLVDEQAINTTAPSSGVGYGQLTSGGCTFDVTAGTIVETIDLVDSTDTVLITLNVSGNETDRTFNNDGTLELTEFIASLSDGVQS